VNQLAQRSLRFIVDSMLGSLARWIRMLGYDTVYARDMHDSEILEAARDEGRILVTRDRGLYRRALRRGVQAILVSPEPAKALAQLAGRYGITLVINPDTSRCPLCNSPLARRGRDEVKGRVPASVYERHMVFWVCTGCGQVYWKGGHWRGIEKTLMEARRMAARVRDRGLQHRG